MGGTVGLRGWLHAARISRLAGTARKRTGRRPWDRRREHLNIDQLAHLPGRRGDTGAGHGDASQRITGLLGSAETAGRVALIEMVEAPGAEPPCHRHHWEDKLLYVLAGALQVYIAGRWSAAPAGAAIWIPRGVEHTYVVAVDPTRVLTMFTPAGFEGFYHEMDAPRPWAGEMERLVATAARYGCEITGPHPGPPSGGR